MKLVAVFVVHNQFELSRTAVSYAASNKTDPATEIVVLDNGSNDTFLTNKAAVYRRFENCGVYPTFWWGKAVAEITNADIVAFFHSDLIINETGWDTRIIEAFKEHEKLGLLGFIGSNQIDSMGGRGLGTTSNFLGGTYSSEAKSWEGSPGAVHGRVSRGYSNAAVVDGCAMVFRASVLAQIPERKDFPPHHFYDRLLSCEVREKGYEVGVLGIGCDHISGQTVNTQTTYHDFAKKWAETRGIEPQRDAAGNPNWDNTLYKTAEKIWMDEYSRKGLIPCLVH
jgi:hypothetical protein